jgi:hypothetical protein
MTNERSSLKDYRSLEEVVPIKFGNGESACAVGIGSFPFIVAGQQALLREVYYVPGLFTNLLSLSCATSSGATVTLQGKECRIQYGGFTAMTAVQRHGLWTVRLQVDSIKQLAFSAQGLESAESPPLEETSAGQLWHRRLGHASFGVLNKMQRAGMVTGMDVSQEELTAAQSKVCEPCIMGKQHRAPFPSSESQAKQRLQLVHMDVCGPMQVPTVGGARYFTGLLDDGTRWSEVCLTASKSQVVPAVIVEKRSITSLEH